MSPASASAIRAGRAYVELFADDSKLMRGLKSAQKKLKGWGAAISGAGVKVGAVGGALMAPLLASAKVFSDMGDDLAKMSTRTGVSVEALSLLGYAADMSGASMEDLENGLRRMQRTIVDGARGSKSAADALAMIGMSAKDLAGMAPEDQFKAIADQIDGIEDPTLKAAAAMMIFGRSGTGLLPLMEGGMAGIEGLMSRGKGLGLEVSTADAKAAEDFQDTWTDLQKTLQQVAFTVGAALAPALSDAIKWVTQYVVGAIKWAKANPQIIVGVLKVAAGVMALGAALVLAGGALTTMSIILGGIVTVFGILGSVLGFILSPLGAVVVLAGALGGYLAYSSGVGGKALGWLGERFADLKSDASKAWAGMSDAMAAGDMALAAKILWLTLKMEWQKGVVALTEAWETFKLGFLLIANDTFWGAVKIANDAFAEIRKAWERINVGTNVTLGQILTTAGEATGSEALKSKGMEYMLKGVGGAVDMDKTDARIESQRKAGEKAIGAMAESGRAKAVTGYFTNVGAAEAELAKTRREWEAAQQEAWEKRVFGGEEAGAPEGPGKPKVPTFQMALEAPGAKGEAAGTFVGAAAEQMGFGTSAADRTAAATERTAEATEELARKYGATEFE